MKLGLICGMEVEARALGKLRAHPRLVVGISAAQPDRATELAEQMIAQGVDVLVSWGIAGALSGELESGALLVPQTVIDPAGNRFEMSGLQPLSSAEPVVLAGSDVIVPTPAAKAELRSTTGAVAVDMETHRVAQVATRTKTPCMAIRSISDPADRALPPGTEHALDDAGRPRILPVLGGLLTHPLRLPALLAAKRDLDCALGTLSDLGAGLIEGMLDR
jgi:adenosylhomocysteine nucleosidase